MLGGHDPGLALRLAQAIGQVAEPFLEVRDQAEPTHPGPLNLPLVQQILRQNPAAFGDSGGGQTGSGWSGAGDGQTWQQGQTRVQTSSHVIPSRRESGEPHLMLNGNGGHSSGSEGGPAASPAKLASPAADQNHVKPGFKIPKNSDITNSSGASKNFKINVNKLSKEDEALMQKSLKDLKFGEKASYNNFSPRAKKKEQSKYKDRSDSESSEDEDGNPKQKSKFFKHTEKERFDEKQKRREEKRRHKNDEGDDYNPGEDLQNLSEIRGRKRRLEESGSDQENDDSWLKRRRRNESGAESPHNLDLENFVPKKVTKKVEKKFLPEARKLDAEELLESNNFKRFNKTMEFVFDTAEEVNMTELNDDSEEVKEIPAELLIPKYQAGELASESAKLKSLSAMNQVPVERLVKLLSILGWNIKDGSSVVPIAQGGEDDEEADDDQLFLELASERVNRAADCAICAMNIMTSQGMSKRVYSDDVIDRIAVFVRFQLQKTIYPSFDPVYKEMSKNKDAYIGSMKKKRNYAPTVRDRKILNLYNRCQEIVSLLAELVQMQLLTDTTVLHLSTMGVAPFFVENVQELQLSALKMVTGVFAKYDKHRKLVLDDILASIARLPQTKRSLRTYRLNKEENIQMLTALVLQLIQCVVSLPESMGRSKEDKKKKKKDKYDEDGVKLETEEEDPIIDRDVHVNNLYESAMATAFQFLTVFLKKCAKSESKGEDVDYRPLFENFLQDLLLTVNTPEWPAAELLLSLLGKMLVAKFANKQTEVSLRVSSLEYLGTVAARLRRDAVQSRLKEDVIDSIIQTVKEAERESGEKVLDEELDLLDPDEQRSRFIQRILLDYLTVSGGQVNI